MAVSFSKRSGAEETIGVIIGGKSQENAGIKRVLPHIL